MPPAPASGPSAADCRHLQGDPARNTLPGWRHNDLAKILTASVTLKHPHQAGGRPDGPNPAAVPGRIAKHC